MQCALYESILATNESWNLIANCFSIAHTSFEKAVGTSYSYTIDLAISANNFLLILGVAVRSGRLFSIVKADWGLESCSLYGVERWPFLSSWPFYSVWLLFGGGR